MIPLLSHSGTSPELIFAVFALFIVISIVSYFFSRKAKVLRALRKSGVKRIRDFSDGDTGKIIGRVLFAGETIVAPLSKRQCVYYHVVVEELRSSGKNSSWHKIIEEEIKADVVVNDGTGFAIIDASDAMSYLVPDANYTSGTFEDPTPELEYFLTRHKIDGTSWLGFNKKFRYHEGVLEKDETFAVAGEGQWNETKDHKLNLPSSKVLVIIPGKNEKVFLSDDPDASQDNLNEQQ